jgi:CheY-specific phosphatase CheX
MDISVINNFTEVFVNTIETTANIKPFRYADFAKISSGKMAYNGLICLIEFKGQFSGCISFIMPTKVAAGIYGAMMFEEVTEIDDEVAEGFMEIANMLIGNLKADLNQYKLEFQTPIIKAGVGEAPTDYSEKEWLYVPLAIRDWGRFSFLINTVE